MKNKCLKTLVIPAVTVCICFTAGCANKAEVVLANGETTEVELKNDGKIINPFDYYDIVFSGYNGIGTAEAVAKQSNQFEIVLDKKDGLSNGDTVTATAHSIPSMGDDVMSPAYMEFKVSDLEEPRELDPFEGLEVQFDGISPYVTASFNTSGCEAAVADAVSFRSDARNLADGDTFTVTAEYNETALIKQGYYITNNSREYKVDNPAKFITAADDIDFTQLGSDMYDYIEAKANSAVSKYKILGVNIGIEFNASASATVKAVNSIEEIGSYIMSLKSNTNLSSDKIYNKYYKVYCVSFSWEGYRDSGESKVYAVVGIDNISTDKNGNLRYNIGQDFNPEMLYYEAEATEETLNSKQIVSEKDKYNVTELS